MLIAFMGLPYWEFPNHAMRISQIHKISVGISHLPSYSAPRTYQFTMIPFDEIDSRLEKIGKNRSWLAESTGRSVDAIRSALAPGAKAKSRSELLQRALSEAIEREEEAAATQPKPPHSLVLEFDDEQYAAIERAALQKPESIREWAKRLLNDAADVDISEIIRMVPAKPHILAAAGSPISAEVTDWDGDDDTVLVRISGLSMAPLLNDGDIIPMKHKKASRNPFMKKGLIYLVAYDGGYTVKRYNTRSATAEEAAEEWIERGKVKVLESINPAFPEIIIKQPLEWVAWLDGK